MSNSSTIPMPKCDYCGNYHYHSAEMCRDMHKIHAAPGMFGEIKIMSPCNECEYRKAAMRKKRGSKP